MRYSEAVLLILLASAVSVIFVNPEANAQVMNEASLSVGPSILTLVPGHSVEAVVSISSNVDDDFTLYVTGLPTLASPVLLPQRISLAVSELEWQLLQPRCNPIGSLLQCVIPE